MLYEWHRVDGVHRVVVDGRAVAEVDLSHWRQDRPTQASIDGIAWLLDRVDGAITARPEGKFGPVLRARLPETALGSRFRSWLYGGRTTRSAACDYDVVRSSVFGRHLAVRAKGVEVGRLRSGRGLGPGFEVEEPLPPPDVLLVMWVGVELHADAERVASWWG